MGFQRSGIGEAIRWEGRSRGRGPSQNLVVQVPFRDIIDGPIPESRSTIHDFSNPGSSDHGFLRLHNFTP